MDESVGLEPLAGVETGDRFRVVGVASGNTYGFVTQVERTTLRCYTVRNEFIGAASNPTRACKMIMDEWNRSNQ